ncbi:PepSY domain-containing protein [Hoeflea sp.]|uniref:PepSY domain-containing protein n=1 Tax=Hoeflea sp. TaxID=1940281 RepID=UPI003B019EF6
MMKLSKATLLAGLVIPGLAFAQVAPGDKLGTAEADIRAKLEAHGYTITEFEVEDGEIEVEATLNGVAYEIEVSSQDGNVVEIALEDEDEDSNDS